MKKVGVLLCLIVVAVAGLTVMAQSQRPNARLIVSGVEWHDTDGNRINAHGGGVMFHIFFRFQKCQQF